jgi:single-stranded-DNA-specific exonuclease
MEVAKVKRGAVDAGAIGFTLGPRLNAAGRLESALASYQLLITNNVFDANQLAAQLNVQNRDRQTLTKKIAQEAKDIALRAGDVPFLFAAHKDFNSGVVGLAAARLCEEFYRPAIVAQIGESETKGSARSIKEFHVTEALDACADLLVRYGGLAAAAGFTIANDKVELFAERLRNYAAEKLKGQNLQPALRYDLNVQLSEWTTELTQELKLFEPCGYGNPSPVFTAHDLEVRYPQQIGAEGLHLRMQLCEGEHKMQAVAFRQGAWATNMPKRVDVLYALEWNEWNGEKRLQMNVKDIKGSGS